MSNVVAFMNMKGGVGKTTLCVNLADMIARVYKYKVLVIDIDPQFNATQCFMTGEDYVSHKQQGKLTSFNIYVDNQTLPSLVDGEVETSFQPKSLDEIICVKSEKLHFIPGDLQLVRIESGRTGQEMRLKRFIEKFKLREEYDFIFVDCPPTNSLWTLSAIIAADFYILPVKPDHLSSVGISLFTSVVGDLVDNYGSTINCIGVVFTLVQSNTLLTKKVQESIARNDIYKDKIYSGQMRQSTHIASIQEQGRFILDLDNDHTAELKRIAREFLERVGKL